MKLLPDITVVEEALFEALPPYITTVLEGVFNFPLPGTTFGCSLLFELEENL
jgi:hypothetical protein